jgi:hypothetical protein
MLKNSGDRPQEGNALKIGSVAVVRRIPITVGLCSIVPMLGAPIFHRFPLSLNDDTRLRRAV